MKIKIITTTYCLLIMLSLFSIKNISAQPEENNLYVQVDVVKTFANGTYSEYPAINAKVNITHILNSTETYILTTNQEGWVSFPNIMPGTYNVSITYPKAVHNTHGIHVSGTTLSYERVQIIIPFYTGSQITSTPVMILHPVCSVRYDFPRSTYVNATIESYELDYMVDKDYEEFVSYTFIPTETTDPVHYANGTFWYKPNYTVCLRFQTLEEGFISRVLVDNGTSLIVDNPLYYVQEGVNVELKFILHVERFFMETEMADLMNLLGQILLIVKANKDTLDDTVVPDIQDILAPFSSYLSDEEFKKLLLELEFVETTTRQNQDSLDSILPILRAWSFDQVLGELSQNRLIYILLTIGVVLMVIVSSIYVKKRKAVKKTPSHISIKA